MNAATCSAAALASPARFERATFRLGGGCSIQLSYGDMKYASILSDLAEAVKGRDRKKIAPFRKFSFT